MSTGALDGIIEEVKTLTAEERRQLLTHPWRTEFRESTRMIRDHSWNSRNSRFVPLGFQVPPLQSHPSHLNSIWPTPGSRV